MRVEARTARLAGILFTILTAWGTLFFTGALPLGDARVHAYMVPILVAWLVGGVAVHGFLEARLALREPTPRAGHPDSWRALAEYAGGGVFLVVAEYFLLGFYTILTSPGHAPWPPWVITLHVFITILVGLVGFYFFHQAARCFRELMDSAAASAPVAEE